MGKRKPLSIGRFAFDTQTEAMDFVREVLNAAIWSQPLTGEVHEFALSLLERHPRASQKIGCGVEHFTVDNDENGSRCFYVHRTNGTRDHFSYLKSLKGQDDVRSLVVGALNRAIDEQIWNFRDRQLQNGPLICSYTGQSITKDSYHVDHHNPTFLELYRAWMTQQSLGFENVEISEGCDNEIGRRMMNPSQIASWQQYHRNQARLRMLSPLGNLSAAKIEANWRIRQAALESTRLQS